MSTSKVKVVLANRKATFVGSYPRSAFEGILRYRKPGWEYSHEVRFGRREYYIDEKTGEEKHRIVHSDGYTNLLKKNSDSISSGLFLALQEKMEEEVGLKFIVTDNRHHPERKTIEYDERLRGYQEECVLKMNEASLTGGLILNATGTGKTFIAGSYLKGLKGNAVFIVDELTLLKQAKQELEKVLGEKVGEIGNQVFKIQRITVATIQTIHRHRFDHRYVPWTRTLQVIFIDEVHLALNRRNFQTIRAIKPPTIFGLTATLELKRKHIALQAYDLAGPVVFEYPLVQGVKEGFLVKGLAVAVKISNPVEPIKYTGKSNSWYVRRQFYRERYPAEYVNLIVEGVKRNRMIRDLVKAAHKKGKYTIVLLERVAHLHTMSEMLGDIPHELVYGKKNVEQRVDSKVKFEDGRLRVLLANKVFKKGVDIKQVNVIIDGAGMKSKNDAVQKYGRGVRLADGKVGLIYFDMADDGNRFEKAAKSRRLALKRIGVPVYKVDGGLGATKILELAEKRLASL